MIVNMMVRKWTVKTIVEISVLLLVDWWQPVASKFSSEEADWLVDGTIMLGCSLITNPVVTGRKVCSVVASGAVLLDGCSSVAGRLTSAVT